MNVPKRRYSSNRETCFLFKVTLTGTTGNVDLEKGNSETCRQKIRNELLAFSHHKPHLTVFFSINTCQINTGFSEETFV